MVELAHRTVSLGTSRGTVETLFPWWWTVLTSVALGSLVLGLALLVLAGSRVAPMIPVALFALALGALVGTILTSGRSTLARPEESLPAPSAPTLGSASIPAAGSSPPRSSETPRRPVSARGSSWRVLSAPVNPGDETWLSWLPRERRRLFPETGGVVPGVVPSPGRAGNLVAFPVRDYFGGALPPSSRGPRTPVPIGTKERILVGDAHLPRLSSPRASPFSDEELDRMFPPDGRRGPVILPSAPDRIGGASTWARFARPAQTAAPEVEDVAAESPAPFDTADNLRLDEGGPSLPPVPSRKEEGEQGRGIDFPDPEELNREATNPIPPHLRASGPLIRFDPARPSHGGKSAAFSRSVCASCSKVVVNLRMSGPCPKCLRPLCSECLRAAMVTHGHGWCQDCASASAN